MDLKFQIRKAFHALVQNNIRAAPIWDSQRQLFVGLLTVTDLIHLLIEYANNTDESNAKSLIPAKEPTETSTSAQNQESPKKEAPSKFEEMLNVPLHKRTISQRRDSPKHSNGNGNGNASQHNQHCFNHLIYALAEER